jgi:mono/diheme cytochrome c family protein
MNVNVTASGSARLAAALMGMLSMAGCEREPTYPANAEAAYARYCASCHGLAGGGDGPAADSLTPRPTDLTASTLDVPELMKVIDGRRTVRAHGTQAMPVWGEVFEVEGAGDDRQHRDALRRVQGLAEYVLALRARAR